jgi:hypothetical protein
MFFGKLISHFTPLRTGAATSLNPNINISRVATAVPSRAGAQFMLILSGFPDKQFHLDLDLYFSGIF